PSSTRLRQPVRVECRGQARRQFVPGRVCSDGRPLQRAPRHRFRGRAALLLVALQAWLWASGGVVAARADETPNGLVLEDDGPLLDPPRPLTLAGKRARFVPARTGGYDSVVEPID